jgi:hypothetical protein
VRRFTAGVGRDELTDMVGLKEELGLSVTEFAKLADLEECG